MDVIVDTCIVMANPTMRGRYFQDLFDHLRRTDSRLIILPIVFDEVVARYEERLSENLKEALEATKVLNGTTLVNVVPPIEMDVAQETRRYKGFLSLGLRQGVVPLPLRVLSDYSTIDVKEVAARGITSEPKCVVNAVSDERLRLSCNSEQMYTVHDARRAARVMLISASTAGLPTVKASLAKASLPQCS
jgi:hypothetical protein